MNRSSRIQSYVTEDANIDGRILGGHIGGQVVGIMTAPTERAGGSGIVDAND